MFDSGVGGLTVLSQIRHQLPGEHLLYVADSGQAPYGDKTREAVEARSIAITAFLIARGAKAIVIACNTATSAAGKALRTRCRLPIIAIEPPVKPAVSLTRSGVVGVLATSQTLAGHNFEVLRGRFDGKVRVLVQPCPGLVERIEAGDLDSDSTRALLADYVLPLIELGADNLVLGCTHYPLVRTQIQAIAGPGVIVTDAGAAVARQLRHRLTQAGLLADRNDGGEEQFWTSGEPGAATALFSAFWEHPLLVQRLPPLDPNNSNIGIETWTSRVATLPSTEFKTEP